MWNNSCCHCLAFALEFSDHFENKYARLVGGQPGRGLDQLYIQLRDVDIFVGKLCWEYPSAAYQTGAVSKVCAGLDQWVGTTICQQESEQRQNYFPAKLFPNSVCNGGHLWFHYVILNKANWRTWSHDCKLTHCILQTNVNSRIWIQIHLFKLFLFIYFMLPLFSFLFMFVCMLISTFHILACVCNYIHKFKGHSLALVGFLFWFLWT